MCTSTNARMYDNKTHTANANNTRMHPQCILCQWTLVYTHALSTYQHTLHKDPKRASERFDMNCYDSNSVSFRALYNSRKTSVKTSFQEDELSQLFQTPLPHSAPFIKVSLDDSFTFFSLFIPFFFLLLPIHHIICLFVILLVLL